MCSHLRKEQKVSKKGKARKGRTSGVGPKDFIMPEMPLKLLMCMSMDARTLLVVVCLYAFW